MTDETTAQPGAGAAAPADTSNAAQQPAKPAPRNDAEAAQQEAQAAAQQPTDAEKAAKAEADRQAEEKKKQQGNRTRDYINRINGENAEMRRRIAELEAGGQHQQRSTQPPQQQRQQGAPKLEDYNYDFAAWSEANSAYQRREWAKEQQQAATVRQQQETQARYDERANAFADQHPDFFEAVGSIDPQFLTAELQAAVIGHEKGPEIAYHLANNEDELWSLASIRAELLPAAIGRLAARLGAAPPPAANQQQAALAPTQQQPNKPISNAPPPPPSVSGRSPTDIPPEKLTDDEWYRRDAEKRRKR